MDQVFDIIKKLACHHAMSFYMVGHIGRSRVYETLVAATTTEELGPRSRNGP